MRSARSMAARILPHEERHAAARMHAVADLPAEREDDFADRHLKAMIESMSRAGCSEREIVDAVERASGRRR